VGTNTHLLAVPLSAFHEGRRPTMTAVVANFGVHRPRRNAYDHADPQSVLGRLLFGFDEERDTPWVTYDPDAVLDVRRDVLRAIAIATAAPSSDEYADWFASQLRAADTVLAHAARERECVVAVFEGDDACFRRGGLPHHEPGDDLFAPHCTMPPDPRSLVVPLGIVGALVTGLAVAGWRHRRFALRAARGRRSR
jgi:hypothetical protein